MYQLYRSYVSMTRVFSAGQQLADPVVNSWVQRGYDSDELLALGPKRAIKWIEKLALNKPGLDNQIFLMQLRSYAKALRKQYQSASPTSKEVKKSQKPITAKQLRRLEGAFAKFEQLKADQSLMKELNEFAELVKDRESAKNRDD